MTLFEHFAQSFQPGDVDGAIAWAQNWYQVHEQELPADVENGNIFSMRSMSGHISDYLEGFTGEEPESYNAGNGFKPYYSTKYGSDVYFGMMNPLAQEGTLNA
jgi:hypothetical protein